MKYLGIAFLVTTISVTICSAGTWTVVDSGAVQTLNSLAIVDDANMWAVGEGGTVVYNDGVSWTGQTSTVSNNLKGVAAFSADDVWAVGAGGTIIHFDGVEWSAVEGIDDDIEFHAVGGSAADDIWATGTAVLSGSYFYHYDGINWTEAMVTGISYRSIVSNATGTFWAAGAANTIGYYDGADLHEHHPGGNDNSYFGVAAVDDNHVWAVGHSIQTGRGEVYCYDGAAWNLQYFQWETWPLDIEYGADRRMLCTTQQGLIFKYDVFGWGKESLPVETDFNDAEYLAPNQLWMVGRDGAMLYYCEPAVDISTNLEIYHAGDAFELNLNIQNPGEQMFADLYVILDVFGAYYFYDGWTTALDFETRTIAAGYDNTETLLAFTWPDGAGAASGINFWAALLESGTSTLASDYDMTSFSFE